MPTCLRAAADGVELDVLVQPRASRSRVVGLHDGRLKVQLAAPPVDGEANLALVELLADLFGVGRREVRILRGDTGRRKTVAVARLSLDEAARHLPGGAP